jgi:AcrR family transcriptional regulator
MRSALRAAPRGSADRTRAVAQAALAAFSDGGYRLTQISHVSERLGVAVGSIYRFVESKEALFHLAVLEALGLPLDDLPLPAKVSGIEDTAAAIRAAISRDLLWPILRAAVLAPAPADPKAEAQAIAAEIYDAIAARAPLISLLDRCAHEAPELADIFDRQMRRRLMADLVAWVIRRGFTPPARRADAEALARGAMEAIAWLAKSRLRDPTATAITDAQARAAAVRIFANAFDA